MNDQKATHRAAIRRSPQPESRPQRAMLAQLFGDRRGSPAFEMALMMPVLLTMFVGVVQYALLYYTYNAMIGASRSATRAVAMGTMSTAQAEALARGMLPPWVPAADYAFTITDGIAGAQVSAQIVVPTQKASVVDYLPMPATMQTRVVMVKEG